MRLPLIGGIILVLLGGFMLLQGSSFSETHDVVKVGDVHVTDTDTHRVPVWVSGAILLAGVALAISGARKTG